MEPAQAIEKDVQTFAGGHLACAVNERFVGFASGQGLLRHKAYRRFCAALRIERLGAARAYPCLGRHLPAPCLPRRQPRRRPVDSG